MRTIGTMQLPFDDHLSRIANTLNEHLAADGADDERERQTRAERAAGNARVRDQMNRAITEAYFGPPEGRFEALVDLGNAFLDCGECAAAERAFRAALLLEPGAPEPLYSLALAAGVGDDREGAVLYAVAALEGVTPEAGGEGFVADIVGFLISLGAAHEAAGALRRCGMPGEIAAAWVAHSA